jgi:DMSO/TMAO reductase YedYZ molybdopterin-dependent catalytic subunit
VDATCVLQCSGNGRNWFQPALPGVQWRYGAVGNARWSGARISDILTRVRMNGSGRHLHTFGGSPPPGRVPPFNRSIEIEKAMDDVIVAYEMNGEPLPHNHGGPARLVVPGWAGDHWMKWLRRLTVSPNPQTGFYMDTAYRLPIRTGQHGQAAGSEPLTQLLVKSNITTAPTRMRVGAAATLRGFAFSGAPDIARVQLTDDGGATWRDAVLDAQHAPHAWRLWSLQWQPSNAGVHTLAVRATDSAGQQQPENGIWNPGGYLYNGWHSVSIEVER